MTDREWTEEEVVDAFLLEGPADRRTLAAFLERYPQHADALIDVAHEIAFIEVSQSAPPAEDEAALIAKGWSTLQAGGARALAPTDWTRDALARMQGAFDAPMVLFTALRDRRFRLETVPLRVVEVVASSLSVTREALETYLGQPAGLVRSAAYKAVRAPSVSQEKIDFVEFLDELDMAEDDKRRLLEGPG